MSTEWIHKPAKELHKKYCGHNIKVQMGAASDKLCWCCNVHTNATRASASAEMEGEETNWNWIISLCLSAPDGGAAGASTVDGATQNLLTCDSTSAAGETADILCRYKKIMRGENVTADLVGLSEYSNDISVSSHRVMQFGHWQDLPEMYRPKNIFSI